MVVKGLTGVHVTCVRTQISIHFSRVKREAATDRDSGIPAQRPRDPTHFIKHMLQRSSNNIVRWPALDVG